MSPLSVLAVLVCAASIGVLVYAAAVPRRVVVPLSRLDPTAAPASSRLSVAAEDAVALAERLLRRAGRNGQLEAALEKAGMRVRPADVLVVTGAAAVGTGVVGLLLGGPLLGLLLALAAPAAAYAFIARRRSKRQKAFTEQLDDALQLMSSSLRAGHSVLRALDAVSRDTQAPTSEEFSRVVNETRVGRDVNDALDEVAQRTGSDDFAWMVQAIAIHREVGGNLAEVLDRVGTTIRERNELRREARALSAEGRVSGIVLLVMPVAVTGLLFVVAPASMAKLTGSGSGLVLLVIAASLMAVGAVWLKKIVTVRF
jgi:tight adherence protein B